MIFYNIHTHRGPWRAEPELEAPVVVEVEEDVQDVERAVAALERELVFDRPGHVAGEVPARARDVEPAADRLLVGLLIEACFPLEHAAKPQRELIVRGRELEARVVVVVIGLQPQVADLAIAHDLRLGTVPEATARARRRGGRRRSVGHRLGLGPVLLVPLGPILLPDPVGEVHPPSSRAGSSRLRGRGSASKGSRIRTGACGSSPRAVAAGRRPDRAGRPGRRRGGVGRRGGRGAGPWAEAAVSQPIRVAPASGATARPHGLEKGIRIESLLFSARRGGPVRRGHPGRREAPSHRARCLRSAPQGGPVGRSPGLRTQAPRLRSGPAVEGVISKPGGEGPRRDRPPERLPAASGTVPRSGAPPRR